MVMGAAFANVVIVGPHVAEGEAVAVGEGVGGTVAVAVAVGEGVGGTVAVGVAVAVAVGEGVGGTVAVGDGVAQEPPAINDTSSITKLPVPVVGPIYSNRSAWDAPLAKAFKLIMRSV